MAQQVLYQAQDLSLRQEQVIAPHQIQSLEILAVPLLDLQVRITQEIEANPALEQLESVGEQLAGDPVEDLNGLQSNDGESAAAAAEKDEFLANLMQLDEGWADYLPPGHATQYNSSEDDERRRYFFDALTTGKTLQEELLEQLRTSDSGEELSRLGELIIGNIDETGYLRTGLDELARTSGAEPPKLEEALHLVQAFDPPGVGARDLRECLLRQLERLGQTSSPIYRVVDKHLEALGRNRIPEVAKALRLSTTSLYEILGEIRKLQPRPGNSVEAGQVQYVSPEVVVTKDADKYVVDSSREYLPRLRISATYKKLLESPDTPADVRQYVREKILNGNQLMNSIKQRQSTITRIAEIIVARQQDYFELGQEGMKPLTMSQVADEIGVHETTVSRAIANKFVETPRGLFLLRHFFNGGLRADDGEMLSNLNIKSKLQELVSQEDSARPLSDQQLVRMLATDGLKLARRTVAKYREELGIPSSRLRRSYAR